MRLHIICSVMVMRTCSTSHNVGCCVFYGFKLWRSSWPSATERSHPRYRLAPGQHIKYVGMCKETLSSISSYWDESTSTVFVFSPRLLPFPSFHPFKSRSFPPSYIQPRIQLETFRSVKWSDLVDRSCSCILILKWCVHAAHMSSSELYLTLT